MQNASSPIPGVPRVLTVSTLFKGSKSKVSSETRDKLLSVSSWKIKTKSCTSELPWHPWTTPVQMRGLGRHQGETGPKQDQNPAGKHSVLLLLSWHLAHMCHDVNVTVFGGPTHVAILCSTHMDSLLGQVGTEPSHSSVDFAYSWHIHHPGVSPSQLPTEPIQGIWPWYPSPGFPDFPLNSNSWASMTSRSLAFLVLEKPEPHRWFQVLLLPWGVERHHLV